MPTRHLILFDCDGTLVDSQHDIVASMNHAFKCAGLPAPTRVETLSIVGLSPPEAIVKLTPGQPDATRELILAEFRSGDPVRREAGAERDPLYSGAAELIAHLSTRDDLVLGVATGKSIRGVARLFDRYDWHGHFATIQTADTNPSKPHPGMIETALAETGIDAANCIMIGDTSFDMTMARAANVHALGVAWGYHPVARVQAAGAHGIVEDFAALRNALGTLAR